MKKNLFTILVCMLGFLSAGAVYSQTDSLSSGVNTDEVIDLLSADEYPVFPGCESAQSNDARINCYNDKVREFLGKNLKYPQKARKAGIEGIVLVKYTIGRDGMVRDIEIVNRGKTLGEGLEEEALRVVGEFPYILPARQNGKAVAVSYMLPIRFALR